MTTAKEVGVEMSADAAARETGAEDMAVVVKVVVVKVKVKVGNE